MHVRKRIRDAIVGLLSGLTSTGDRVWNSRSFQITTDRLPSISVFTTEEEIERVTLAAPVRIHRMMSVVIEVHAVRSEVVEDVLDQCAGEIETAMAGVITIDDHQLPAQLTTVSFATLDEGEQPLGVLRMVYRIPYSTNEATPDTLN